MDLLLLLLLLLSQVHLVVISLGGSLLHLFRSGSRMGDHSAAAT